MQNKSMGGELSVERFFKVNPSYYSSSSNIQAVLKLLTPDPFLETLLFFQLSIYSIFILSWQHNKSHHRIEWNMVDEADYPSCQILTSWLTLFASLFVPTNSLYSYLITLSLLSLRFYTRARSLPPYAHKPILYYKSPAGVTTFSNTPMTPSQRTNFQFAKHWNTWSCWWVYPGPSLRLDTIFP